MDSINSKDNLGLKAQFRLNYWVFFQGHWSDLDVGEAFRWTVRRRWRRNFLSSRRRRWRFFESRRRLFNFERPPSFLRRWSIDDATDAVIVVFLAVKCAAFSSVFKMTLLVKQKTDPVNVVMKRKMGAMVKAVQSSITGANTLTAIISFGGLFCTQGS